MDIISIIPYRQQTGNENIQTTEEEVVILI